MSRAVFHLQSEASDGFDYIVTPEVTALAKRIAPVIKRDARSYLADSHRLQAASIEALARYYEEGGDDQDGLKAWDRDAYVKLLRAQRDASEAAAAHLDHAMAEDAK